MKPGICRLCESQTDLIFSHIYPEFFYAGTYDESHRFISVTSHPQHPVRPFQKGFREYLLCELCEARFCKYESYAATVLRQLSSLDTHGKRYIELKVFEYTPFKLFALSVIWRCHVTSLHTFHSVKLGSHAKKMRRMLLKEDPGKPNQYGFAIAKITGSNMAQTVLMPPHKIKFREGTTAYRAIALGYYWIFIMSNSFQVKPRHYPVVGLHPELLVPISHQDEHRFRQALKGMIPKSALQRTEN